MGTARDLVRQFDIRLMVAFRHRLGIMGHTFQSTLFCMLPAQDRTSVNSFPRIDPANCLLLNIHYGCHSVTTLEPFIRLGVKIIVYNPRQQIRLSFESPRYLVYNLNCSYIYV